MTAVVTFTVDGILCGLPVALVREVLPMVALRPLPRQTSPMIGLLTLRGELVPVVALRPWLGRDDQAPTALTRIMIVEGGGGEGGGKGEGGMGAWIGLLADEVHDVVLTDGWRLTPLPPDRLGGPTAYLSGLLERDGMTISLLDLPPLLALFQAPGLEQPNLRRPGGAPLPTGQATHGADGPRFPPSRVVP